MAAKLTLELDNKTGKGFADVVRDLTRLGREADTASGSVANLNAELSASSTFDVAEQLGLLADGYSALGEVCDGFLGAQFEVNDAFDIGAQVAESYEGAVYGLLSALDEAGTGCLDLADGFSGLEEAANTSTEATEKSGDGLLTLVDVCSSLEGGFHGVQTGLSMIADYAVKMADDGHESFKRLVDAGDTLLVKLSELGESRAVAHMVEGLATIIEVTVPVVEDFGTQLETAFEVAEGIVGGLAKGILYVGEVMGLVAEGTAESFEKIREEELEADKRKFERRLEEKGERQRKREAEEAEEKAAKELLRLEKQRLDVMQRQREEAERLADEAMQDQIDADKEALALERLRRQEWEEFNPERAEPGKANLQQQLQNQQPMVAAANGNQPGGGQNPMQIGGAGQASSIAPNLVAQVAQQQQLMDQILKNRIKDKLEDKGLADGPKNGAEAKRARRITTKQNAILRQNQQGKRHFSEFESTKKEARKLTNDRLEQERRATGRRVGPRRAQQIKMKAKEDAAYEAYGAPINEEEKARANDDLNGAAQKVTDATGKLIEESGKVNQALVDATNQNAQNAQQLASNLSGLNEKIQQALQTAQETARTLNGMMQNAGGRNMSTASQFA